jgi:hypothetical protein
VRVRPSPSPSIYLHTEGKKKKRLTHARTNQTHARFNYHDDVHTTRACARCGSCHDGSNFYARKDRNISLYIYACAYIYRYTFTLGRTALLPAAIRKQRRNHCAHTYVVCTYLNIHTTYVHNNSYYYYHQKRDNRPPKPTNQPTRTGPFQIHAHAHTCVCECRARAPPVVAAQQ